MVVDVVRPRRRAVLVFLLLHANRSVSTELLVDALWGEAPPRTARAQVHTAVSTLRGALPAALGGQLSSEGTGYRLTVAEGELDTTEFGRRIAAARHCVGRGAPDDAARLLRSGLGLWRGKALAGVDAPFAESARARLEEERFVAHELLADLEMTAGRHVELVPVLTDLLNEHPARESIAERLTLALYRCGRQADALAVVRSLRGLLADEYGLDPGPGVTELEAAMLRGDPCLSYDTKQPSAVKQSTATSSVPTVPGASKPTAPASAAVTTGAGLGPAQLPRMPAGFVGRRDELAELATLLDSGVDAARIAVVSGPAGVGKTSLALRWAHSAVDAFPDGQLFADLHGYDTADFEAPGRVLERFLLALGVPGHRIPADLAQREDLYRSRMADRSMLVVLDNAHDYQQVRPLLPGTGHCLTLVTSRGRMSGLVAETGASCLPLGMLPLEDSVEVLSRIAGADRVEAAPDSARELARLCGGLPLALRISAVRLLEEPATPLAGLAAELTPEEDRLAGLGLAADDHTVSRALDHTRQRLTVDQSRVFHLISLHPGADIGSAAVEAVAGSGGLLRDSASLPVRQSLRALEAVHLVDRTGTDRYAMHDLVRLYGRQTSPVPPAEQDSALDRMFDWYIHVASAGQRLLKPSGLHLPSDLIHRLSGNAPVEDEEQAVQWFDQEIDNLTSLIQLAAVRANHRVVWQLSSAVSGYLLRCHRLDALIETQKLGEYAAKQQKNELAAADLAANLGIAYSMRRDPQARGPFERAVSIFLRHGDLRRTAVTRLNLGSLHYELGLLDDAAVFQSAAVDAARELGMSQVLAVALGNLGLTRSDLGDHQSARELFVEAQAAAEDCGWHAQATTTRGMLAWVLMRLGDFDQGLTLSRLTLDEALRTGNSLVAGRMLDQVGLALAALGNWTEARRSWGEALRTFSEIDCPEADAVSARLRGDRDALPGLDAEGNPTIADLRAR